MSEDRDKSLLCDEHDGSGDRTLQGGGGHEVVHLEYDEIGANYVADGEGGWASAGADVQGNGDVVWVPSTAHN